MIAADDSGGGGGGGGGLMAEGAKPVTLDYGTRRPPLPRRRGGWSRLLRFEETGVASALLLLLIVLSLTTDSFLDASNLLPVARQGSEYAILAVGMVFLLAMGEIDLSVGSMVTLVNVVVALCLRERWPVPAAVAAGLGTGLACGMANGLLSVALRVPTIIVTLGTMGVYRGAALVLTVKGAVSQFPKAGFFFDRLGGNLLGVPALVWVTLLVAAAGHVLLNHTPFGWRVQAIGSNPQAARFSGIRAGLYRVATMTLMGGVCGLAGVMAVAFYRSGNQNTGFGYEIFVIAATIIGGTPLSGGSGTVAGAVLGAMLIVVIRNGLGQYGVPAQWNTLVSGAVIIAAVAAGTFIRTFRQKGERV